MPCSTTAHWSLSWMTVRELTTHDWLADRQHRRLVIDLLSGCWAALEEGQGYCLWNDRGRNPISQSKWQTPVCHLVFLGWRPLNGVTRRNFSSLCHHHTKSMPTPIHVHATKPVARPRLSAQSKRYSNARIQYATLIPLTRYRPAKKHPHPESPIFRPRRSRSWSEMPCHQELRPAMISSLVRPSNL